VLWNRNRIIFAQTNRTIVMGCHYRMVSYFSKLKLTGCILCVVNIFVNYKCSIVVLFRDYKMFCYFIL
jgi:hypothetical protein